MQHVRLLLATFFVGLSTSFAVSSTSKEYAFKDPAKDFRVVRLRSTRDGSESSGCTALVLSKNKVLAAAHCATEIAFDKSIIIQYPEDGAKETNKIFRVEKHEKYNFSFASRPKSEEVGSDIGVFILQKNLGRPSRFVKKDDFLLYGDYKTSFPTFLVGNGLNEKNETNQKNKVLYLILNSFYNPKSNNLDFPIFYIWDLKDQKEFMCEGDSGAPIFADVSGQTKIVGLVSAKVKNMESEICGKRFYAPIGALNLDWIDPLLQK